MVGTAYSVLIREVSFIQCVLYREVPLYFTIPVTARVDICIVTDKDLRSRNVYILSVFHYYVIVQQFA